MDHVLPLSLSDSSTTESPGGGGDATAFARVPSMALHVQAGGARSDLSHPATRPAVAMTDQPRMRRTFRSELAARLGVSLPAVVIEPAPSLGDARNVFRR